MQDNICDECGFEEKYHKVRDIRGYMGLKKPCNKFKAKEKSKLGGKHNE